MAKATATDVAPVETATVATVTPVPVSLFDELAESAAVLNSVAAVLSDADAKERLVDVPIIVKSVVYRDDSKSNKGQYVSMEVVVGPNVGGFAKDSIVVINDGSTGAFRQITSYLEAKGWVVLPDGPSTGKAGETRFDTPFDSWEWTPDAERALDSDGVPSVRLDLPVPWLCRNGVRLSEHDRGTTTYLA